MRSRIVLANVSTNLVCAVLGPVPRSPVGLASIPDHATVSIPDHACPRVFYFTQITNRAIVMIEGLAGINADSKGEVLRLWKRAMCSRKGRVEGRNLINNAIRDPALLIPGIFKLIDDILTPCDPPY